MLIALALAEVSRGFLTAVLIANFHSQVTHRTANTSVATYVYATYVYPLWSSRKGDKEGQLSSRAFTETWEAEANRNDKSLWVLGCAATAVEQSQGWVELQKRGVVEAGEAASRTRFR